jgi:internalin A
MASEKPCPPPARRRLRFTVGALMVVIAVFAVWMARRVSEARAQRDAVAAVQKFGGWVHYDYEFVNTPVKVAQGNELWMPPWGKLTPGRSPRAPIWLRRMFGDEYFREITHVSLFVDIAKGEAYASPLNVGPADLVLEKLAVQSGIKTLQLGGKQATDHGLEHVGRMLGLEELILFPARQVTDAGVAHLRGLKHLKKILIDQSRMTDEGLRTLAELPELEHLKLYRHGFSDAGLAHLKRATKLKTLLIGSGTSGVTDAGLASLQGLADLEELDVSGSMVTDAGLDRLRGLTKLKDVGVNGTSVTSEGLKRFRGRATP